MAINGKVHVSRIENLLHNSMSFGEVHFDQVASKLEQGGVYLPLFKVGQKAWYITTSAENRECKVLVETKIVSILIKEDQFEYTFPLEDGTMYHVDDSAVGQILHKDYLAAVKLCAVLNDIKVIVK